jgi:outer membrane protein
MPNHRLHGQRPGTLVLGASLVIASTGVVATASAEAPRSMTLEAAVAHAREHHPELMAARARVAAARADAAVPRAQWLPAIGGVAQLVGSTVNNTTSTVLSSPLLDLPRIGATPLVSATESSLVPYPSTLVALGIRQTVFDFGRIGVEAAAFDRLADAESHRADTVRLDVSVNVAQAYYAVLAAREVVSAAERALERARAHRDQAKAAVSTGMRSPIELTRAEADVARFELARVRAEGSLAVARGAFAATVGVKETELDAAEPKRAARDGEDEPRSLPSLQDVLQKAEANEPLLKEASARVAAQKAITEAISAQLRPRLFATASISGRGGGATPTNGSPAELGGWVPEVPNWSVGLVLSWPIFDASVHARSNAARVREDAARAELLAAEQRVRSRTQQVYQEAQVAEKALGALRPAADAATANYAQAEARFHAGFGSSLELADAEVLRTQAEIDLAVGKFQKERAKSALERVTVDGGAK